MDIESYYILVPVPLLAVALTAFIAYFCGLKPVSAIGLGLIISVIIIMILHPFHTDVSGSVVIEPGNFYVSMYILVDVIAILALLFYNICIQKDYICCCKRTPETLTYISYDNEPRVLHTSTDNIKVENYTDDLEGLSPHASSRSIGIPVDIEAECNDDIATMSQANRYIEDEYSGHSIDTQYTERTEGNKETEESNSKDDTSTGETSNKFIPAPNYNSDDLETFSGIRISSSLGNGRILFKEGSDTKDFTAPFIPPDKKEVTVTEYSSEDSFHQFPKL